MQKIVAKKQEKMSEGEITDSEIFAAVVGPL